MLRDFPLYKQLGLVDAVHSILTFYTNKICKDLFVECLNSHQATQTKAS